jgi:ParB-like chromosome segregation protein Spo0J
VSKKNEQKLTVEMVNISELVPYAKNSRTHTDQQIAQIAKSIKEFGFTNPVLIHKGGKIIAGHGRVLAASRIGQMEIPVIRLEYLSDSQVKALVIADNQIAGMAGWDFDVLAAEIDALNDEKFDIELLGFTKDELDDLIGSPDDVPEAPEEKPKKPESDTTICPKCHHEFVL